MFHRTRRKIVFTVVFSLFALMTVTLTTIYLTNRAVLDRESREMLRTYVERFSLEEQPLLQDRETRPDGAPDFRPGQANEPRELHEDRPGKDDPAFRLSTFYAVAYAQDGEVLKVNNGNNELQSADSLLKTASAILKKGKQSGKTGNMTYLVEQREEYTLVAMIDRTINDSHQETLIRQMLIIGLSASVALFVISILLPAGSFARWKKTINAKNGLFPTPGTS